MKKIFLILFIFTIVFSLPSIAKDTKKNEENIIEYMNIQWWERYKDDYLIDNLLKLYKNNYDLKNAELKVKENEQIVKVQFANELPQLNFSGELYRNLQSSMQQFGDMQIPSYAQYNYYLPLTMSYEVDIWGTNRLKTKSIKQQLEIIKQLERATYIAMSSSFTADYFNLIKTDELINIQDEIIQLQEEILAKIKDKYETGLCTINEVLSEEKILTKLNEEKNSYIKTRDILINTMRVYLADSEDNIDRNKYENLSILENLPSEYSTKIIENRPDYKQEEANIKRLGFDVKVAKREFLPKFIIFGQIGLNAYHLDSLFNRQSQLFNAGVLPSLDIFSGGRKKAFLKLKKLEYEEALNNYQKTILTGIKEVNTGLIDYNEASKNYKESIKRLELQNKTYNLVKDKYEIGAASNLDVLYAKEIYLAVKKEEVSNKINSLIATISLYKAAGGIDLYNLNEDI